MLLGPASFTDSFVTLATHIIRDLGLAGVALLNVSSAVIGLPGTEPTMLFAGFNVYQGHLSLLGIIVFGLLGDVAGASIAYCIGFYGSRELLERHGAKFHLTSAKLDRAHGWFERYGAPVIIFSRLIPFVRAGFAYAAGVAAMPYIRFVIFTTIGSIPWIVGLSVLGKAVGSNWENWRHNLEYVDYAAIAVAVGGIVYLIARRRRGRGGGPAPDAA